MTALTHKMTAAELERMPADGYRYELVRGELRKMAPTGAQHGRIAAMLGGLLFAHVRAHKLGDVYAAETGFKLASAPDTVRAPDVAFIRQEHLDPEGPQPGFGQGAPDLVGEVISPGDRYGEVDEKVADWLAGGAGMVLVVNPRRRTVAVKELFD